MCSKSTVFLVALLALLGCLNNNNSNMLVHGFAAKPPPRSVVTREELPTLEVPKGENPLSPPTGVSKGDFYLPTYTLLRAGPVSFARRLIDGKSYEQYVYKYMKDFKDDSMMAAQGNADAFLASADDWAEQKYLEGQGRREVYDYGTPLPTERVILSSVWGVSISLLLGRVFWQLLNGNRNLF